MPSDWRTLVIWIVALIVLAIVAVFLFNGIVEPLLKNIT